ncbi:pyridoxamine 5'-phosphate oxidase [Leptobacterium flavescens]|uniref:Pyridoxamine 5'-phosphate oxidase n=1 Tax=Leptobacterium flavescens TaxID=472055 RepID=A0A6P0USS1_9FLAO|nr:pyridoxamine 5'-phosphate oxidase family protein [Leptobacterium flavescens]NER14869.1 pyridoxamine 5'-phosphate oxidase [Leptobacterium flavescens]
MANKFHEGELKVQERIGEATTANNNGRLISNTIIKGAIPFIEKQPMAIVSSVDNDDNIWASVLFGDFGFVEVPHPTALSFDLEKIYSDRDDIFYQNIANGSEIGTLFIELSTRRRFRINGTTVAGKNRIDVSIAESYPNCPKYIQQRQLKQPESFKPVRSSKIQGDTFTGEIRHWISSSDTLFIGSASREGRMDVSHRGGQPGFVEILDDHLKIPDYHGNSLYNTLGNLIQNPKAGLLFIDFENRKTLQLIGHAELLLDQNSEEDLAKTGGTGRYWTFKISKWVITENQHTANWEFGSYSPFNP